MLQVNCVPEETTRENEEDSEAETTSSPPLSTTPSSSANDSGITGLNWYAGLGGLGFLETSYLTYLKLTDTDVFCPVGGGGSCGSVLSSEYSVVFGIKCYLFS